MATIDDVAKKAGVSKATVSRVINGTAPVNNYTKTKIELAMEELNYSPSFLAQSMRSKKTKTIGIVIPDYTNPFYTSLFKEIENRIRDYGYMMLICPSDEDHETGIENIKKLVSRQIDGIILFTYRGGKEYYKFIAELSRKTPCVFMDQVADELPVSQVFTDGFNGVKEAVTYLLKKGHKRIGCIKVPSVFEVTIARVNGYKTALKDFGIPVDEKLIYEGNAYLDGGYRAGEYFAKLENRPTAIVSVTDFMAIGALKYFQHVSIKVPEQIEIIGFDNISLCTLVSPQLSTVAQPLEKLAFEAIKLLINKINNPRSRNKKIVLNSSLIIRRSSDINQPELLEYDSKSGTSIFYCDNDR